MKKTLLAIMLALAMVLIPVGSAFAANPEVVTITANPYWIISIESTPNTWTPATTEAPPGVRLNSEYWWKGDKVAPAFVGGGVLPLADCGAVLANVGTEAVTVEINGDDFSGGVGWTLVTYASPPGIDEVSVTAWLEGDAFGAGIDLTTTGGTPDDYAFIGAGKTVTSLDAPGGANPSTGWEMRLTSATSFTDGDPKIGLVTLQATQL